MSIWRALVRRWSAGRRTSGRDGEVDLADEGEATMRFMVLVKATKESEAGAMPDAKLLTAMGKYNEELAKAGVLLDLSGLHPSSKGARIRFSGSNRTVTD